MPSRMITKDFVADLRATHASMSEAPEPASVRFARMKADLDRLTSVMDHDSAAVIAHLEERWPSITAAAMRDTVDYEALIASLGPQMEEDPIRLSADLLGALDREKDELAHTRVLRSLIDPARAGGNAVMLLGSLLNALRPELAERVGATLALAKVQAELAVTAGAVDCIPDIVIEVGDPQSGVLVVIENKIRAHDRLGQLKNYREWADGREFADTILVYLTPDGRPPIATREVRWEPMSYAALASALRSVLNALPDPAWRELTRLYLATVTQKLLRYRLPAIGTARIAMMPYLRAAAADATRGRKQ